MGGWTGGGGAGGRGVRKCSVFLGHNVSMGVEQGIVLSFQFATLGIVVQRIISSSVCVAMVAANSELLN